MKRARAKTATPSPDDAPRTPPSPVAPRGDGARARTVVGTFVLHLRPVRVPAAAIRFTHTFGLGGMALVLLALLAVTGSLLMFVYTPVPGEAYLSIERLQDPQGGVLFGAFVRAIHHWSANLLVLVAALHLLRVFFTGAYLAERAWNWVVGLGLFAGILASAFTGYLLPWDQLAFWAVTIVTGMAGYVPLAGAALAGLLRGGEEIGPATLGNYYALHTQWLPALLAGFAGFHFWRVRRAKGVIVPPDAARDPQGKPEQVAFLPHLFWRELAVGAGLVATVTLFAALVRAPLGPAANPGLSLNPAKAPWYFLGFQELLVHLHPLFAVVVVPLAAVLALVALPWLGFSPTEPHGAWFLSALGRRTARFALVAGLLLTPLAVVADALALGAAGSPTGSAALVTRGVLPFAALVALGVAGFRLLRGRFGASPLEATQALFVFFATAFVALTLTGTWFRGPGMTLVWPWQA